MAAMAIAMLVDQLKDTLMHAQKDEAMSVVPVTTGAMTLARKAVVKQIEADAVDAAVGALAMKAPLSANALTANPAPQTPWAAMQV